MLMKLTPVLTTFTSSFLAYFLLPKKLQTQSEITVKSELSTTSEKRPPVNDGHKFGGPRMVVVHKFYCTGQKKLLVKC